MGAAATPPPPRPQLSPQAAQEALETAEPLRLRGGGGGGLPRPCTTSVSLAERRAELGSLTTESPPWLAWLFLRWPSCAAALVPSCPPCAAPALARPNMAPKPKSRAPPSPRVLMRLSRDSPAPELPLAGTGGAGEAGSEGSPAPPGARLAGVPRSGEVAAGGGAVGRGTRPAGTISSCGLMTSWLGGELGWGVGASAASTASSPACLPRAPPRKALPPPPCGSPLALPDTEARSPSSLEPQACWLKPGARGPGASAWCTCARQARRGSGGLGAVLASARAEMAAAAALEMRMFPTPGFSGEGELDDEPRVALPPAPPPGCCAAEEVRERDAGDDPRARGARAAGLVRDTLLRPASLASVLPKSFELPTAGRWRGDAERDLRLPRARDSDAEAIAPLTEELERCTCTGRGLPSPPPPPSLMVDGADLVDPSGPKLRMGLSKGMWSGRAALDPAGRGACMRDAGRSITEEPRGTLAGLRPP